MLSSVESTDQDVPGLGNTGSRSTTSSPAAAISAVAASWVAASTSVWVAGVPERRRPRDAPAAERVDRRPGDELGLERDRRPGCDVGSSSVGPAMTSRYRAASRTDRTMGPGTDVSENECGPGPDPQNP